MNTFSYGLVAFDLEGPLSPQDNAYEVMGLTEKGHEFFERLSRYDDILTMPSGEVTVPSGEVTVPSGEVTVEERPGYEPGDTLYLVLPFLIADGLTREDILEVSKKAILTPGSFETIKVFKERGFNVVVISTSYAPHAHYICSQLGIPEEFIACTPFPEQKISISLEEKSFLLDMKKNILEIPLTDEAGLKNFLDEFYLKRLPTMKLYQEIKNIRVIGGRRKVEALKDFIKRLNISTFRTVCVGDSITDFRMLDYINKNGGLSIAFNGNEYSVPYATLGIAADTLTAIIEVVMLFFEKGINAVKDLIKTLVKPATVTCATNTVTCATNIEYSLIEEVTDLDRIIAIHKLMRRKIRGRAGELG